MPIGEGGQLEIRQSSDATARILLAPFLPQNALAKVKSSPMRERATCLKRQLLLLHRHIDVQPIRENSEPRPECLHRPDKAPATKVEGCENLVPSAIEALMPRYPLPIAKSELNLALSRRIHAIFDQQPARIGSRRK